MKRILLLALGICFLVTVNAFAAKIDFRDSTFSSALDLICIDAMCMTET